MTKHLISILLILLFIQAESQNWDSLPGKSNNMVEAAIFDSLHNELIVSSNFMNQLGNLPVKNIARWNGVKWDTLGHGLDYGGTLRCGVPYNGKLLVGGVFPKAGGLIGTTSLALWDGLKWDSLPKRAFSYSVSPPQVWSMYKKGSLVYLCGSFTDIAGQPATGLATWDGVNFTPIALPTNTYNLNSVNGFIEYQNEFYVCGGFFNETSGYAVDILKFDGSNWVSTTGGGLKGPYSGLYTMTIYNSELYVGGHFWKSEGNFGDNIMKWNGSQWKDVGFGGDPSTGGVVVKLLVHHNKLWAVGNYEVASHITARSISVFDGSQWCILKDSLDNGIQGADIYRDTIYAVGGFWSVNKDSAYRFILKLKEPDLYKSCNAVGIKEFTMNNLILKVSPNPASTVLHFDSEQTDFENSEIEITNALGQTVLKTTFSNSVNVSGLSRGYYNIKIYTRNNQTFYSKFIKE